MKFVLALAIGMAAAAPTSLQSTAEAALAKLLGHEGPQPKGVSNGVGKGVQTGDSPIANINKEKDPRGNLHQNRRREDDDPNSICGVGGVGDRGPTLKHATEMNRLLHGKTDSCYVGPGPGACSRLVCDRGAAIWLCNDNTTPMDQPCKGFCGSVSATIDACTEQGPDGQNYTRGQHFTRWEHRNIIIGPDPSC